MQAKAASPPDPTLVFLHAFPLHGGMWMHQFDNLRHCARVALDFRGYGKTALGEDEPLNIGLLAHDVIETLDLMGVERFIACGCSMGGYTMFELWRRAPQRFQAMILCDTRAEADSEETKQKRAEQIQRLQERGSGFMPDFVAQNLISSQTRNEQKERVAELRRWVEAVPVHVLVKTLQALADRPDSGATLPTISVPTLIVIGEDDTVTPMECSQRLHREIEGSQLITVPRAGHLSPFENSEFVTEQIQNFIDELRVGRTGGLTLPA